MPEKKVSAEVLKNGKVLTELIRRFHEEKSEANLLAVLSCLRDSQVLLPLRAGRAQAKPVQLRFGQAPKKDTEEELQPDVLATEDGKRFLPIFSQVEQMPEDYATEYPTIRLPMLECIRMAEEWAELDGIIVNPYTQIVAIEKDVLAVIRSLPSRLELQ